MKHVTPKHVTPKADRAPWLLLPAMLLTLGGVSLLAPHPAALAAPPLKQPLLPPPPVEGDGDGDELLEHWSDPQFGREERIQMAGAAAGFLLLGGLSWRKRARRQPAGEASAPVEDAPPLRKAA